MNYTEKNIQKLLHSGFNKEYQLDEQFKDSTMNLLLQKVARRKKATRSETTLVVAFTIIWIVIISLFLSGFSMFNYMRQLIKTALGLSLIFVPVSSFILIILKKKTHEKELV